MDLKSFLAKTELFREAGPRDNRAILDFFDRSQMQTRGESGIRLRYERSPDFFRFLAFQGDQTHAFVGQAPPRESTGEIDLVCSLSVRDGYQAGQPTRVGYLGDLRVHSSPRLTASWRKTYGELLAQKSEISELRACESFLTAILRENEAALRALVTPKKDFGYRYIPRSDYRMVMLLAALPRLPSFSRRPRRAQGLWRRARPSDQEALVAFLDRCGKTRPFGFCGEPELTRRLKTWPDFSLESFWLAREPGTDQILGAFAPWSPSPYKKIRLDRASFGLRFGLALGRAVGLPLPATSSEMKVCYLTWLELAPELAPSARLRLFQEGVDAFWQSESRPRDSLIAFCDFDSEPLISALAHYLKLQTPLRLYEVCGSGKSARLEREPFARPPGFEMALV